MDRTANQQGQLEDLRQNGTDQEYFKWQWNLKHADWTCFIPRYKCFCCSTSCYSSYLVLSDNRVERQSQTGIKLISFRDAPTPFFPSRYQFRLPNVQTGWYQVPIQCCIKNNSFHIISDFSVCNTAECRAVRSLCSSSLLLKIVVLASGTTAQLPLYCFTAAKKKLFQVCDISQGLVS